MAADDLFGIADRGEIGAGVPLEEEIEVDGKLAIEASRPGQEKIWGEEGGDLVGGHGFSLAGCSTWNIRTSNLASVRAPGRMGFETSGSNDGPDNLGNDALNDERNDEPSHVD